jgi:hypothetical protein
MINLIERTCISCGLLEVVDGNQMCGNCSPVLVRTARLAKQKMVQNWLDTAGVAYKQTDRILPDSAACSVRSRPDFVFDAGTHFVVLEVDEHQHQNYVCESARMVNITSVLGLPTVFVRFNPDRYKPQHGREAPFTKRRDTLLRVLRHQCAELRAQEVQSNDTGTWLLHLCCPGRNTATAPNGVTLECTKFC